MAQATSSSAEMTDPPVSPPPPAEGASPVSPSAAQSVAPSDLESENQSNGAESMDQMATSSAGTEVSGSKVDDDASPQWEQDTTSDVAKYRDTMPGIPEILETLANLQRKFEQMESRMNQIAPPSFDPPSLEPPTPSPSPPFVRILNAMEPSTDEEPQCLEDIIIAFKNRASLVARAKTLHTAKKFPDWKDRVFEQAKVVACLSILENREETYPADASIERELWEVQNEWLYEYMLEALGPPFQEVIVEPSNRSAYLLWRQIESYVSEVDEDDRRYLIQKLMTINAKNDVEYISTFQKYYNKIKKMGFTIPDWMAQDLLSLRVSERTRDLIQKEINAARNAKDGPFTMNTDTLIARVVSQSSLKEIEQVQRVEPAPSVVSSSAKAPQSTGSKASNSATAQHDSVDKEGRISCGYCSMLHHGQDDCFYKYPERTSAAWQKAHKSGIDFFKAKAESIELKRLRTKKQTANTVPKVLSKPNPVLVESKSPSDAKTGPAPAPASAPDPVPASAPTQASNEQPQTQVTSHNASLACDYCGKRGHNSKTCPFQFPELESADWRMKNKHLIDFYVRKDKLRKRKQERLKAKQLLEQNAPEASKPERPESGDVRPTSPENLLILDL